MISSIHFRPHSISPILLPSSSHHWHHPQVVAIKQINEDARMLSEQQLAFVREMSVLTQARCRWCDGMSFSVVSGMYIVKITFFLWVIQL
jgi:hypothetical protein